MENCAMTVRRTNSKVCDAQIAYFVDEKLVFDWFFWLPTRIFNPLLYQLSYLGTVQGMTLVGGRVIVQRAFAVQRILADFRGFSAYCGRAGGSVRSAGFSSSIASAGMA
jgi:hypothetical protein